MSIYGNEAAEVKRDYALRELFRRDHKRTYIHLSRTDLISGKVTHNERDDKENLLEEPKLQLEIPKFIDEDLLEIGDKLPFYEDFKASRYSVTPNSSRNYSKLCLIEARR